MPIINDYYRSSSDILSILIHNNSILFTTRYHGIKKLDTEKSKIIHLFEHREFIYNSLTSAFSKDGSKAAFGTRNHIYIIDLKNGSVLKKIDTLNKHIILLSFDDSSNYIVAGTKDGRVMLYKYNSNYHISRLFSFNYKIQSRKFKQHYISSIAFYKNFVAVAGHRGVIFVTNIYSQSDKKVLFHNTFLKTALHFIDTDVLVSGDNDGNLQFISIRRGKIIKTIHLGMKKISQIVQLPNTNYLLIHSNTKKVFVIDAKKYTILHTDYIKFDKKIDHISALNSYQLIALLNKKEIVHVELPSTKKLNSLILHNAIESAFELLENEPMLLGTKEHQKLENIYKKTYKKALNALVNKDKRSAQEFMRTYENISSKKETTKLLFKSFEQYDRFSMLYQDKKYAICYAMAEKYPALKETKEFQSMEKKWREVFVNAQKLILNNNKIQAQKLFYEFIPVQSKRNIIHLMLKDNSLFIEFVKAVDAKNFKVINKISQQNKLFLQMPIYERLYDDVEMSIENIKILIKQNGLDRAIEFLKKIEDMPNFQDEVETLYKMCKDTKKLQNAYAQNDFVKCYELIDKYPHLSQSELGTLLEKHWFKLIDKCENYALRGDAKGIKTTLQELIKLKTRTDKIGSLLRLAFQVHIAYLIKAKKFHNAKNLIYSYIDIFTKDVEIEFLMEKYETASSMKLAITQIQPNAKSRDAWQNSTIID